MLTHQPGRTRHEGFISDWSSQKVTLTNAAKGIVVPDSVWSRLLILECEGPCHGFQIKARCGHSFWQSPSLPQSISSSLFPFLFSFLSSFSSFLPFLPVMLVMEPTALHMKSRCSAIRLQSQPWRSLNNYSRFTLKTIMSLFVEFMGNLASLQFFLRSLGGELWEERSHVSCAHSSSAQQPPHADLWNKWWMSEGTNAGGQEHCSVSGSSPWCPCFQCASSLRASLLLTLLAMA